ncbi:MAG: hypothetical protein JNJ50_01445 [Acidobacteria bacterium]|nr:hypothetical protein [Acidobacteriota bacterium]
MKALLWSVLAALLGYVVGGTAGFALVSLFSSNRHDKSVEASMTGLFVVGPLFAVLCFVGALFFQVRKR